MIDKISEIAQEYFQWAKGSHDWSHTLRVKALAEAARWIRGSKCPLIIAGGGVIYSGAEGVLKEFVEKTGIPVGVTMAGKGCLLYDNKMNLGAMGVTGNFAANRIARDADLVIGIGTRYSDFTTMSKTAFQNPDVRFVNIIFKKTYFKTINC